jgi:hypothetical protein
MNRFLFSGGPLALLLALAPLSPVRAQAATTTPATPIRTARTEEYCQVRAQAKLNGRVVVSIDFGQQRKALSRNLLRDAAGQAVEFNSAVDALNWLNAQGWELASTFVVVGEGSSAAFYVMRRRLPE